MINIFGSLCIISAPSGTGKTTLIDALQKKSCFIYNTQLSISYTTRKQRFGETHGKDYYFISKKKFQHMIDKNMFFEYAKIFNHYYGTEINSIKTMLNAGIHVILNIDWQGAKQIRNKISNVYTIFILPPSQNELEKRLRIRDKDTDQVIITRMKKSIIEMNHLEEYDYIIINDNFDIALMHLKSIIISEQLRFDRSKNNTINKLITYHL